MTIIKVGGWVLTLLLVKYKGLRSTEYCMVISVLGNAFLLAQAIVEHLTFIWASNLYLGIVNKYGENTVSG